MAIGDKKFIKKFGKTITSFEESISELEKLVANAVTKQEQIIIVAQHLHPETYKILEDAAGKTQISLVLLEYPASELKKDIEEIKKRGRKK